MDRQGDSPVECMIAHMLAGGWSKQKLEKHKPDMPWLRLEECAATTPKVFEEGAITAAATDDYKEDIRAHP